MHSSALNHPEHLPRVVDSPNARRFVAVVIAACCTALLAVASFVSPASAGVGTHEQLNLPSCGWITLMELPCMTCGMTTAFAHAARGSFLQSMMAQPMGFALAMATAMALLVSVYVAMTGSCVTKLFARLWSPRMIWLIAAFGAVSWGFKILTYRGILA